MKSKSSKPAEAEGNAVRKPRSTRGKVKTAEAKGTGRSPAVGAKGSGTKVPARGKGKPVASKDGGQKDRGQFGYVLSVMTCDHPGIVARLSEGVARLGGNIESCSQTVLSGYFTLTMTVRLAANLEPGDLVRELLRVPGLADCQIYGSRMGGIPQVSVPDANLYVLTAFGKDCPGIVLAFSRCLADKRINIVDLYGERHGNNEFVLIGQVEVDPATDIRSLLIDLEEIGRELGFTVKLQHKNIFVATNQLRLSR